MSKIVLREKIFVPVHDPDEYTEQLDNRFIIDLFKEDQCEPCPERDNRPNDVCGDCQNYLARKKLYIVKTVNSVQYIGFPYGKRALIKKVIPEVTKMGLVDRRPDIPFKSDLRFTGTLRPHQAEAIKNLVQHELDDKLRGLLVAPARSGKTITSIALSIAIGKRTLILTNQHFLCKQFYETCVGGEDQAAMTNAPKLEKSGKKVVVLASKLEDFFQGDIVISTYQRFISELGSGRLKEISSLFSLLIVDEVHRVAASSFLKVAATLNTQSKLGLTATVTRKDGMDVLTQYVFGPVLHRIKIETLVPTVVFHETLLFPKKDYSLWTYYCRWLERSETRTDMIIDLVMADLKAKRSIVIPCMFTSQIAELVRRINWTYGRTVAAAVQGATSKSGKLKNEQALEDARSGKIRVIVGTQSIIGTGVNVPLWDTIHLITPISNPPNFVQIYSRILTPLPGKKPLIRMYLDGSSQTRGCLRTCLFRTEGAAPTLAKGANISIEQWAIANAYLRKGRMSERVSKVPGDIKKTAKGRIAL